MTESTGIHDNAALADLLKRLREGSLTTDELTRLREILDTAPDESLIPAIDEAATECASPSMDDLERLRSRIYSTIDSDNDFREKESPTEEETAGPIQAGRSKILHIWAAVAAVMIPCLLGLVFYLWIGINSGSGLVAMSTKPLDKAEISLPDGTAVNLRGNSRLSFESSFGHSGERIVNLDGQAYFKVAKDSVKKFIVKSPGLDVTVHGTEFSIVSRSGSTYAEVILDSGSVTLTSAKQSVSLTPGNTATIDRHDGSITILPTSNVLKADWATDELSFNNISPDSLVTEIEKAYDIKLSPAITDHINQRFTGTLPWNDLGLTLDVLRYVYGFDLPYQAEK